MNPLISCVSSHAATSEKKTVTGRDKERGVGKREEEEENGMSHWIVRSRGGESKKRKPRK